MAEIIQFVGRLVSDSDWTRTEKVRLLKLAESLDLQAPGVEAVFGESDEGDPWCVIKDGEDNVLVHVARIGSTIIVHDISAGLIKEGGDLLRLLDAKAAELSYAEVQPLPQPDPADAQQERRNAHALMAVVMIQAFGLDAQAVFAAPVGEPYSTQAALTAQRAALPAIPLDHVAPIDDSAGPDAGREVADAAASPQILTSQTAPGEPDDGPHSPLGLAADPGVIAEVHAPEPVAMPQAAEEAPAVGVISAGETLAGGPGLDLILGGLGDDVLSGGGAPTGAADVIDGGSGDDKILVDPSVVAIGGKGADIFVVAPRVSGAGAMLGVVVDFNADEGDTLVFSGSIPGTIVSISTVDDILGTTITAVRQLDGARFEGQRWGVDFNGDGFEDGYLLVAGARFRIAAGQEGAGDHQVAAVSLDVGAAMTDPSQVI
jgi:hypothetical protein